MVISRILIVSTPVTCDTAISSLDCLFQCATLGDIFKTLEMRRFFKEFAIFSDGQNFGFQNKIRRIIFDMFLLIVTSSIHHLHDKLLI